MTWPAAMSCPERPCRQLTIDDCQQKLLTFINTFMNRNYLSNAIRSLAEKHDISFVEASAHDIAGSVAAYPVVWLEPVVLQSKSGRRHGRIIYSVRLHLMHDGVRLPPAERRRIFDESERLLLEIFTELSTDERIACVDELTVSVSQFAHTPHGEIAATAQAEIETIY